MAKTVKSKIDAPTPATASFKPCLYLDMQGQDVSQIKNLNIGDKVEILVTGTVKGLSQRQRPDYDNEKKTVQTGTIDLESYSVQVMGEEDNEYEKMAKDES